MPVKPKARYEIVADDKTAAAIRSAQGRVEKFTRTVQVTLGAAFAALGGGLVLRSVMRSTAEAEKAFAQLAATVKSTGGVAGFSADQLRQMSSELQNVTTFGDETIQAMQSVLLTFTRIRGPELQGAQEAVLDMATLLGTDLKSAATQVGKALNDPIKGVSALGEAGVQLTASQKATIESLQNMGDIAGAQRMILAELETQFGGSARAARDNFGGALEGVKNALGDLLEAKGGLPEATESLKEMSGILQDPAVAAGADVLFSTMIRGAAGAAKFIAEVSGGLAILAGQGKNEIVNLDLQIEALQSKRDRMLQSVGGDASLLGPGFRQELAEANALIDELMTKQRAILEVGEFSGLAGLQEFDLEKIRSMKMGSPIGEPPEPQGLSSADKDRISMLEDQRNFMEMLDDGASNVSETLKTVVADMEDMEVQTLATTSTLSVFADQAARNMQSHFADFLFDPFDDGLKGMAKGFADTIRRMIAEAAAAELFTALFGDQKKDGSSGLLGSFLGGLFGGAKADGGAVNAGRSYLVGERGPELFTPSASGMITPNSLMPTSTVVNQQIFNIQAGLPPQWQAQLATATQIAASAAHQAVENRLGRRR